jgi:glucose uptake protein
MYQPEAYFVVLAFMVTSMICWGSWANTMKLTPGYAFQLFYWDYSIGIILGALVWGLTLGSFGSAGPAFLDNLRNADSTHILYGLAGGAVFSVANLLLVAAIDIAGLAVAFPVGIGLALVVGVLLNYLLQPKGNVILLFGGVVLVMLAIVFDALAYRNREVERRAVSARGIQISIACGILMGVFYPLVVKAKSGSGSLGSYAVAFVFCLGAGLCAIPLNHLLMKKPLTGAAPVDGRNYFSAPFMFHVWGMVGGAIWCTGLVFNLIGSGANVVGPAISYAIGQGATMVSAIWGVFIWREFVGAPANSRKFIPLMFLFFVAGLFSIAFAPIYR